MLVHLATIRSNKERSTIKMRIIQDSTHLSVETGTDAPCEIEAIIAKRIAVR
jgi:hypothetical protein